MNYARMQKYKEVFVKVYIPNWSEEIFGIKNVKNVLPQTYFSDLNAKKNVGTAYGEKLQKPNQKQVRIEELMKKKKVTNYKSSGKVLINHLIAAYI